MSNAFRFDDAADHYRFRIPYPPQLFDKLAERLGIGPSTAVLDLCTGTGEIACALAAHAGSVLGVDESAAMLARATAHPKVGYLRHDINSESLAQVLGPRKFEILTVGRAIHWIDQAALGRIVASNLRPGPQLVVLGAGWSRQTPWRSRFDALARRYRDARAPTDYRGREKLAKLGAAPVETVEARRQVRCGLEYLVRQAMSYSSAAQAIAADLPAFRQELESLLAPFMQAGALTGTTVGWADVHRLA